jgi:hypothetical protein
MPFKAWIPDEVFTSGDVNSYLMRQSVAQFASTAARDAAILSPTTGQFAVTTDTGTLWRWDGFVWRPQTGGMICTSATRPTGYNGLQIYETDTFRLMFHNGTGWVIVSEPPQTYTPTATNITVGTGGTLQGVFQRSAGYIDLQIYAQLGSAGFSVTANPLFSLPTGSPAIQPSSILWLMQGSVVLNDASGSRWYGTTFHSSFNAVGCTYSTTGASAISPSGVQAISAGGITATAPFTWATSDSVQAWVRFQMAERHSFV